MVTPDDDRLSEAASTDFLERVTVLESQADLRWRHVREGALAAGFDPASVAQAESEVRTHESERRRPGWVRFCLAGVPNRAAAQFWYGLLSVAGLVSGVVAVLRLSLVDPALALAASVWFFGCAQACSSAIRWMDRNGAWESTRGN